MAGKTSYLLNKKFISIRGTTGGAKMIKYIKDEENLCKVLMDLGLEVYFYTKIKYENNVIFIEEPSLQSKNIKK